MDSALEQARNDVERLLEAYGGWSSKFETGKVDDSTYGDLIDFINTRMETVDSCSLLLKAENVSDVLLLCRSLIENYLLFILLCRGTKYFIPVPIRLKGGVKPVTLAERRKGVGKDSLVAIEEYPFSDGYLAYIFEGLKIVNNEGYDIPYYYFAFRELNPLVFRLDEHSYFSYLNVDDSIKEKRLEYRRGQKHLYRHYLSYEALLYGLKINDIVDDRTILAIQAHYTFLGSFLHPTNDSFRDLHERSNVHYTKTVVGFEYQYERKAMLLAYVYVIKLATGMMQELADKLDSASNSYMIKSGSHDIRKLIDEFEERYSYFWFIFNGPSDYDKFEYCINQLSNREFQDNYKSFKEVDSSIVTFEKDIYKRFSRSLYGWHNDIVGKYIPPV